MERVREQYAELQSVMAEFQVSVSECLAKAESEFLQAYRAHMVEVHRELQELRDCLVDGQRSVEKDEEIQTLEQSTAWFREEAGQLAAKIATMEKEKGSLVERLRRVDADRGRLTRRVKGLKKQLKLKQAVTSPTRGPVVEEPPNDPSWLKTRFLQSADDDESGGRVDDCDLLEAEVRRLRREYHESRRKASELRRTLVTERADLDDLDDLYWRCLEAARFEADRGAGDAAAAAAASLGGGGHVHHRVNKSNHHHLDLDRLAKLGKVMFPPKADIARQERLLLTSSRSSSNCCGGGGGGPQQQQQQLLLGDRSKSLPDIIICRSSAAVSGAVVVEQ